VWEWYHWRQSIILKAKPNPAHYALVELEQQCANFLLLTQNVDNLHRRAGSKNILELHGNIFRARCLQCHKIVEYKGSDSSTARHCDDSALVEEGEAISLSMKNKDDHRRSQIVPGEQVGGLPTCTCGGLLRPDVVWFGESIPQDVWQESLAFLNQTDVALICGTSGIVWPAAAIPELARKSGAQTIEVNLEPTPITPIVDIFIQGKAGEILPRIIQKL
jgi:NAD-dependent deacetylase